MFHASRNWNGISGLVGGMRHHVSLLPHSAREKDGRHGIQLIDEHGEMIQEYDVIFRELFCLAAASLADRLRDHITSVGVLWDEILPTGALGKRSRSQLQKNSSRKSSSDHGSLSENVGGDVEKGVSLWEQEYARGSLMFLIRRVESDRDAERYVSVGYRFAETQQVSGIIRTSMQIKSLGFDQKLRDMATYTTRQQNTRGGVQLGCFVIRARPNSLGFEIMVRKGARNLLPAVPFPVSALDSWHIEFMKRFENLTVIDLLRALTGGDFSQPPAEAKFARQLAETIQGLQEWTQEPLFDQATLTSAVVDLPSTGDESSKPSKMVALRLVIPIHAGLSSPVCELVPLNFFRMHQIPAEFRQEFTRGVHEELGPIIKKSAARSVQSMHGRTGLFSKLWPLGRSNASMGSNSVSSKTKGSARGSSADSVRTGSTINLCPPSNLNRAHSIDSRDESTYISRTGRMGSTSAAPSYGGIMVFQEIKIDVEEDRRRSTGTHLVNTKSQDTIVVDQTSGMGAGIEMQSIGHMGTNVHAGKPPSRHRGIIPGDVTQLSSFVDVLFSECVEGR